MTDIGYKCPICDVWVQGVNTCTCQEGLTMLITTCSHCKQAYTTQAQCPVCDTPREVVERAKKPKPAPKKPASQSMLSYDDYVALSPNSVSKEEYKRYVYLYDLQSYGVIHNLELQVKYEVQPRVVIQPARDWYKGFTQSRQTYSPDFRYRYDGLTIVEEYKAVYKPKRKPSKKPGQILYPLITKASRKSIKLLMTNNQNFVNGDAIFVISGWYKPHRIYYAFNANNKVFDYPLANYVHGEALRPTG